MKPEIATFLKDIGIQAFDMTQPEKDQVILRTDKPLTPAQKLDFDYIIGGWTKVSYLQFNENKDRQLKLPGIEEIPIIKHKGAVDYFHDRIYEIEKRLKDLKDEFTVSLPAVSQNEMARPSSEVDLYTLTGRWEEFEVEDADDNTIRKIISFTPDTAPTLAVLSQQSILVRVGYSHESSS